MVIVANECLALMEMFLTKVRLLGTSFTLERVLISSLLILKLSVGDKDNKISWTINEIWGMLIALITSEI